MENYISTGDIVTVTAPGATKSGDIVTVGSLSGIACADADSGADVEIKTSGVFTVKKTSAQAWTQGAKIYVSSGSATTADGSGSNPFIGYALAIAANPSATGIVRLSA